MNPPAVHHIALWGHDLRTLERFYIDVIGLAPEAEHTDDDGSLRSIWLRADSTIVMLEHAEADAQRGAAGWQVVAFEIDASERETVRERLNDAGFPVRDETDYTLYTRDPEGNRVALSHWPDALTPTS